MFIKYLKKGKDKKYLNLIKASMKLINNKQLTTTLLNRNNNLIY